MGTFLAGVATINRTGRIGVWQQSRLSLRLRTTDAERLQNTATAANNNGSRLTFAASRTTSGLTDVAGISGLITDISQSAYKGAIAFSTADNAAPSERMRIDNTGNVGIGTTSPTRLMHSKSTDNAVPSFAADASADVDSQIDFMAKRDFEVDPLQQCR